MPILDDDDATSATTHPIIAALSIETLDLSTLSQSSVERAERQLDTARQRAAEGNIPGVGFAFETLLVTFESASTAAVCALADRIDAVAAVEEQLYEQAGLALTKAGLRLWNDKRNVDALPYYERAAQRLSSLRTARAITTWGDAVASCASLSRLASVDTARQHFEALYRRAIESGERLLCFWTMFAGRRVGGSLIDAGRHDEAFDVSRRAAALLSDKLAPQAAWYEHGLYAYSHAVLALRHANRFEEALALAREALAFAPGVSSDAGRERVAWIATEAAFIAADRMSRPDLALPFVAALRTLAAHPKAHALYHEVAYAIAMEAKALVLLGRSDEALASCDEAIRFALAARRPEDAHAAHASALHSLGEILAARGQREAAIAAWTESVERFGSSDEESVREEVSRARSALKAR